MIGQVEILQYGEGNNATIDYLRRNENYNWVSELPLTLKVNLYGAVMAQGHTLVNVESYVAFRDESDEVNSQ